MCYILACTTFLCSCYYDHEAPLLFLFEEKEPAKTPPGVEIPRSRSQDLRITGSQDASLARFVCEDGVFVEKIVYFKGNEGLLSVYHTSARDED